MKKKSIVFTVISAAVLIAGVILAVKLLRGAVTIVSGAFNAILGIAVILALLLIILWMFRYARKHRK